MQKIDRKRLREWKIDASRVCNVLLKWKVRELLKKTRIITSTKTHIIIYYNCFPTIVSVYTYYKSKCTYRPFWLSS